MQKTSRRRFLTAAAISAAALPGAASAALEVKKPDETFDIVVVGSGVAGTIAAITAAEGGARVLLVEKMNRLGGTSRFSGLNFACVGSPAQKAKGVKDSPEALAGDMARVSGGFGNYQLALHMAKNTARAEKWLTDRGVRWDGRLLKLGGHSAERCLIPEGDGAGLLRALWKHMEGLKNLVVRTNVKVDDVMMDENGRTVGVYVRENYRFNPTDASDDENNRSSLRAAMPATRPSVRSKCRSWRASPRRRAKAQRPVL